MAENIFGGNPENNPESTETLRQVRRLVVSVESSFCQTGELADACGTTVRTVQYYDGKGLLAPTGYSEGGRRLYSPEDAERLRFILLLKALGLKLAQIKGVLESPNRDAVLRLLLDEQAESLAREIDERTSALELLNAARTDIGTFGTLVATTEPAMVTRMNDEKARRRWWAAMIALGVLMDAAWIGTLVLGIVAGTWWPFPVALAFVVAAGVWMVARNCAHSTYLCPACGAEFRTRMGTYFWSGHTPRARRLTCPCCHQKDWCVERYHADALDLASGQCVPGTCHGACEAKGGEGHDAA